MRINAVAIIQVGDYCPGGVGRLWSFKDIVFCISTSPASGGWQRVLLLYED